MKRFAWRVLESVLLILLALAAFITLGLMHALIFTKRYAKDFWTGLKLVWTKSRPISSTTSPSEQEIDWMVQNSRI